MSVRWRSSPDPFLPRFAAFHLQHWDLEDKDQRISAPVGHLLSALGQGATPALESANGADTNSAT
jgi:hypothetical protein